MGPPLVKKKIDSRIRTLLENGVKSNHRTFYVIVGDRGRDQVMYLHFMLSKARVAAKPSVLWCYKKNLGFTTHRKKRMKQISKQIKQGLREADESDPFELFIAGTDIRYCYYKETQNILGNTYGMCVLQDFEALTPNLLARTIETVEGGGIVVVLLKTMSSLKQLYTMTMDVHARYRTESHNDVVNRFNERFILSLGSLDHCLIVDDELNILPISAGRKVTALPTVEEEELTEQQLQLKDFANSMKDQEPVGTLIRQARTFDQAKAIKTFVDAISEKTLRNTVSLTAARGRGKSAALGIAMAAAIAYGYSNVFVTSPSPENLKTLFEIMFKAFDALGYQQHIDYNIIQSTNPDFNKAVVRVNIFRDHRQTIQYIKPEDSHILGQAELVVIDEAAAIPLPVVKKLLGPYLVFMASTINGYEGTGRSLSLKLLQQLRDQSFGKQSEELANETKQSFVTGRNLREIKLEEPIRYGVSDPIEKWLNSLLCLDTQNMSRMINGCPHPSQCDLYVVNRDTLFSYHPVSEAFLQKMMSLYVASHYKNSPNDLQLMSDAPAHQLFVLLPPVDEDSDTLPEPLAVIQVCLEGQISRESLLKSLSRGKKADGDLIPWAMSQQFQDDDFASLSGARVVRIAVHPDYSRMGYGSRALQLLIDYYEGKSQSLLNETDDSQDEFSFKRVTDEDLQKSDLHSETLQIRDANSMPPLFLSLSESKVPNLHWVGVSYGLTPELLRFWKRAGFAPVYLRQTSNELTGEHTCIMLKTLERSMTSYDPKWLNSFTMDFKKRFLSLSAFGFSQFTTSTALSLLESIEKFSESINETSEKPISPQELNQNLSAYDLKRLESYGNNMLDYHVILDLIPTIANHYFNHRLKSVTNAPLSVMNEEELDEKPIEQEKELQLSPVQRAILFAFGFQHKQVEDIAKELNIPVSQVLALFIRIVRKSVDFYKRVLSDEISGELFQNKTSKEDDNSIQNKRNIEESKEWDGDFQDMDQELQDAGNQEISELKRKQREMIDSLDLESYAIEGNDEDWQSAGKVQTKTSGVISIKSEKSQKKHKKGHTTLEEVAQEHKKFSEKIKKHKKQKKNKA